MRSWIHGVPTHLNASELKNAVLPRHSVLSISKAGFKTFFIREALLPILINCPKALEHVYYSAMCTLLKEQRTTGHCGVTVIFFEQEVGSGHMNSFQSGYALLVFGFESL